MNHTRIICTLLFLFFWGAGSLSSEPEERPSTRNTENSNSAPPRPRPRGFSEGGLYISIIKGRTMSVSGSFIDHEKAYDAQVKNQIRSGFLQQPILPGGETIYFDSQYIPRDSGQMDIEYGISNYFGTGLTAFQYTIGVQRQDIVPALSYSRPVLDPLPQERNLFQGSAVMALGTFHPLPGRILDPYLTLRGGFVGFTGEAHAGVTFDRYRYSNKIQNGLGSAVGGGLGLNVHLTSTTGIKMEAAYYREFLRSDIFSTRSLNSYHVQIGIFINYTNISGYVDDKFPVAR